MLRLRKSRIEETVRQEAGTVLIGILFILALALCVCLSIRPLLLP